MKRIALLGSTGSIGESTLAVLRQFPKEFRVAALSVDSNIVLLKKQIREFHPKAVCVRDTFAAAQLSTRQFGVKVFKGELGLREMLERTPCDEVVMAISGSCALAPLLTAIDLRRDIVLANKEALVMAGALVMAKARRNKVLIKPVDSEQSAIWQCLSGEHKDRIKSILLTASGGPFRGYSNKRLKKITVSDALRHPRWKMGKKITVDSATLMNKGLEVIEAMYLFGAPLEAIKIVIHPEAVIHSMVEFVDGIVMAQLSVTDMRIPIQYALNFPVRRASALPQMDFVKLKSLHFEKPDLARFPCLTLAYEAAAAGGTLPAVMNAANEVSVDAFLAGRVGFLKIPWLVERVMKRHRIVASPLLRDSMQADAWARAEASALISTSSG